MGAKPVLIAGAVGVLGIGAAILAASFGQTGRSVAPLIGDVADARDVEALARMLASENPSGSRALWTEQCWTQINSRKRGQSLYARITGNQGFGTQNKKRPVSTVNEALPVHRAVARLVLLGTAVATWVKARKFFEPKQQDAMFRLAEGARAKRVRREQLTARETRALGYEKDSAAVRREWASDGSRLLGEIDGVEFWS